MKITKKILGFICLFLLISCAATPKLYVKSGDISMEVKTDAPYLLAVDFSPDGKSVVTGGADGTLRRWSLFGPVGTTKFDGHTGWICDASYSPDGKTIVSISMDGTMRFWDATSGRQIRKISGYFAMNRGQRVRYLPNGKYVLGSTYTYAKLHDVQTGDVLKEFSGNFINIGGGARFSPDCRAFLMLDKLTRGQGFSDIVLKDIETGHEIWRATIGKTVFGFAYKPDGKEIVAVRQQLLPNNKSITYLVLLNAKTGYKIKEFPGVQNSGTFLSNYIDCFILSPDGKLALTGDLGGHYRLWDVSSGRLVRQLTVEEKGDPTTVLNIHSAAAFSPDGGTVVVASRASMRLFDVATGTEIVTAISFADGEWLMTTPEGYYNASEKGAQYLNVKFEGKDYSVDQFYDVFYRPDIVAAKLGGQDISGLISISMKDASANPPPIVDIAIPQSTNTQKVKVCYKVKSTGGGIGEVRLFHNGKLIQSDGYYREMAMSAADKTKLAALDSKAIYADMRSVSVKGRADATPISSKPKTDLFEDCKEIDAIPGENEVSITAFNSGNTVQSYMKTIKFNSSAKSDYPHLYIFAIGIDNYRDNTVNLKYALKDAKDLEEKLKEQSATLYKQGNIHYLLLTDKEATKTNVVNKINELASTIKPQDSFILFVAGHGVLLQNQYYMLTHDYNGTVDSNSMISSNEIVEMSKKIKSLSQLFIFDTCHAGGVDYIVSGLYDARMSVLAKKMGLHIYASASDKQAALDGYKGNGLFTYTLLDGLNNNKEADKNKDGKVTVVGLGEYSKKMTTNLSKEIGHSQTPLIINFGKDSPIYKLH